MGMSYEPLRKSYARGLLKQIVQNGFKFELECDNEELLPPTSSIEDGVAMMFEVDECTVYVLNKAGETLSWVWWLNYNDWDESISDYGTSLDRAIDLAEWNDNFILNLSRGRL